MSSIFVRSCPIVLTALILSACSGNKSTPAANPTPPQSATQAEQTVKPQDNGTGNTQANQENMTQGKVTEPQKEPAKPPVVDVPTDKPAENPTDKPTDNTASNPPEKPTDNPANNPSEKPTDNTANNLPEKPSEQVKPAEPAKPTENIAKEITGFSRQYMEPRLREMPPYIDPLEATYMKTEKTDNLYTLVVDGQKIDMLPEGAKIGGTIETQEKNEHGRVIITKELNTDLQYAVTGAYTYPTNKPCAAGDINCEIDRDSLSSVGYDPNLPKHIYFVQGFETLDMPTNGTAEYVDHKNTFLVNFGEKTVNGNLLSNQFTAKISGNKFATERDPTLNLEDVFSVNGGFFGPNAAEMAGVYNDHDKYVGTFSAKKTEK
ncbi:transferrin-binding protein-like solute binding protein [Aggregatibacter kilianii]|uniref:transferrin-binding protein-like solute binding protein n=1 Tax=Aggregatibacter kilianii TaxID=2025884 RepID=UPI000D65E579|nr:transferrin-binding protein-like solute binding protein [Aggregatibacter kilianii]